MFPWTPSARNSLTAAIAAGLLLAGFAALAPPRDVWAGPANAYAIPSSLNASHPNAPNLDAVPAKKLFGHVRAPAPLPPQAYGSYARGCLAGAEKMPVTGSAWQVMRLSRNRNWGHPRLIELVKRLAIEARTYDGWPGLLVGDFSQPRGGPMLTGHASHQIGLDADIWLTPMPDRELTRKERETMSAKLMVLDRKRINPERFTVRHAKLIRRAAKYPEVQRIFVHPPIKKYLCDWSRRSGEKDRSWLAKVRPYYGHNYHFHIRLRCPPDAKNCKNQGDPRPKDGTGCGKELAYWYSDRPWKRKIHKKPRRFWHGIPIPRARPKKPRPRPQITLARLPAQCRTVLLAK